MNIRRVLPTLVLCATLVACSPRASDVSAVRRGDEAFAVGNFEEALAEYRLAVRQGADDPTITARIAHTYTLMGRVDDAGAYYVDASARDPGLTDQAVSDLMRLARRGHASNDRFAMATAVETALRLRPGIGVGEMSLPLARHYFQNGHFEVGQAHEEIGDCAHALIFFERFREMVRPWERGEVDWYIGTCAFNVSRDLRDRSTEVEDLERALQLVNRTVEVGQPNNIQAQAWFEKGEILAEMGDCQASMEAYAQVRYADQAGSLIDRAQDRFDEIKFGQGLERIRGGRCR